MVITQVWAEAIADYLASQRAAGYPKTTLYTRRQHLEHIARRIDLEPWEVAPDDLVAWAAEQPWSASTRRSRRTTLQSFYGWGLESGRIASDPSRALKRVKQPTPSPRPVPRSVYLSARMRADELERVWMELAFDHGLRRGELALIHSRDLIEDLVGWSLLVHGKGARDRVVPLTGHAAEQLLERIGHGEGWLAPGADGGHISPWWLGSRVNRLLDSKWTIHSLRHAAGTKFNAHGGLLVAQKLLGHASVATTQVYCAVPDDALRATVLATAS